MNLTKEREKIIFIPYKFVIQHMLVEAAVKLLQG